MAGMSNKTLTRTIGRLAADAGQFHQFFKGLRYFAAILITEDGTVGQNILGLAVIEAAGPESFLRDRQG